MLNATTTCNPAASGTICTTLYGESTSTDPTIVNGFTAGEIVISTLLFLIFALLIVIAYQIVFRRIKIKNQ